MTVTLAGHPAPLAIDAQGRCRELGAPGTLLGVLDEIKLSEVREELARGETLLLYTDGLTDAGRGDRRLGERGLPGLCAQAARAGFAGMLERIEREALERAEGRLRDDIAMLSLRLSD